MLRLRALTRRQAVLAVGACVLGAAVAGAALTGNVAVALTLLAFFFTILFGGLLLVARRIAGLHRAQRRQQADVRAVLDQTQRRVLGAIEELRLHSGDRHRELTSSLADRFRAQTGEVEALVQLFQQFTPRAPMPSPGDTDPTVLLDVVHLIRTRKPRVVLELGCGPSTVWMAYALEEAGGKLVALDHDGAGVERARAALRRHGLTGVAEVRPATLRPVTLEGRSYPWYDLEALADVPAVELLVIGGPPEGTGPDATYPALRLLEDRLSDGATVIFVEVQPDPLRRWLETIEGLTQEGEALGRHAVLSYQRIVRQLSRSQ